MKKILFKAKSINTDEWFESMTIAKGTIKRKRDDLFMEIGNDVWKGINPETVCELIGSINGHQYFNNHIIKSDKYDSVYIILWNKEELCYSLFNIYEYRILLGNDKLDILNLLINKSTLSVKWIKQYGFYPIGNIFDNPELLK